jgi:hypothetical protein
LLDGKAALLGEDGKQLKPAIVNRSAMSDEATRTITMVACKSFEEAMSSIACDFYAF